MKTFVCSNYAPCDRRANDVLWESLLGRLKQLRGQWVYVCGDFNEVRSRDERHPSRDASFSLDSSLFNHFIDDNVLIDLSLCGHNYTWFKGDGTTMSRLDRFLLSEEWCLLWPNCVHETHLWGLSDHFPLILSVDEENWDPRPTRMLICW